MRFGDGAWAMLPDVTPTYLSRVDAVEQVAAGRGVPMAQVALAWVLSKPVVAAPVVGATKPHHLADAAAAVGMRPTEDEVRRMEEPYTTQPNYWW